MKAPWSLRIGLVFGPRAVESGKREASLFDAADSSSIVSTRTISTVAPQALFMLNDPFVLQRAKNLAARANSAATQAVPQDDAQKIDALYELLFARLATPAEREIGLAAIRASDWEAYCQVLLCSNEFMYVD